MFFMFNNHFKNKIMNCLLRARIIETVDQTQGKKTGRPKQNEINPKIGLRTCWLVKQQQTQYCFYEYQIKGNGNDNA